MQHSSMLHTATATTTARKCNICTIAEFELATGQKATCNNDRNGNKALQFLQQSNTALPTQQRATFNVHHMDGGGPTPVLLWVLEVERHVPAYRTARGQFALVPPRHPRPSVPTERGAARGYVALQARQHPRQCLPRPKQIIKTQGVGTRVEQLPRSVAEALAAAVTPPTVVPGMADAVAEAMATTRAAGGVEPYRGCG